MNETEFKHHLKDLAHGHHKPEEHDWDKQPVKKAAVRGAVAAKRSKAKKGAKSN